MRHAIAEIARRLLAATLVFVAAPAFAETVEDGEGAADSDRSTTETFLDAVTVTASRSERTVGETTGQVDVVGYAEIEEAGHTNVTDLVQFTPGIYVDGDVTRLGASGFNIRGIGGNRVQMQIDGIPTAEQFEFGPFTVTQYSIDLDAVDRVEFVRSAGSALYGSDALGGVVAFRTRGPLDYLAGESSYFGARLGYDDRAEETSESIVFARGGDRVQGSLLFTHRDSSELDNQGELATEDFTRTAPNPIDRESNNALFKLSRTASDSVLWELAVEWYDTEATTEVFSSRTPASPFSSSVLDFDAVDTQQRIRASLEQSVVREATLFDSLRWRAFWTDSETDQDTESVREGFIGVSDRVGFVGFQQETAGFELEAQKGLGRDHNLTYGISLKEDAFEQLRDRTEIVRGAGIPVPTPLVFPTRYFPQSDVTELGAYVQAELSFFDGRFSLIPGMRFDDYSLDADENDAIFIAGNPGTEPPVDLDHDAVSPKLGVRIALTDRASAFAQYSRGFRAPPMSTVNNGFTNFGGGYRTLANPDLDAETSDNFELGLRVAGDRGSLSVVAFDNQYDDFIETVFLGFNPAVFLVEFQPQNIENVSIDGYEIGGELWLGERWKARLAYANVEGTNDDTGEPLESIAPNRLVTGLRYEGRRWGSQLVATLTGAKDDEDLPSDSEQFRTPSYERIDLSAWYRFNDRFSLQVTGHNLTDEEYWDWSYVRGQVEDSPTIDRYTSPGTSFGAQLRFSL